MPHMTPRIKEMLGRDRSSLTQVASKEVKNLLFRWLDTWIPAVGIAEIDAMARYRIVPVRRNML